MFVYMITNSVNGKYYVGKHKGSDLDSYFRQCVRDAFTEKRGQNKPLLYRAIRKHGAERFSVHVLMGTLKTDHELKYWEKQLIALFNAQDPAIGYNISDGGDGVTFTAEVKAKMRKSHPSICGANHPMHRPEVAAMVSLALSGARNHRYGKPGMSGEENPMFGKTGILHPRFGTKHSEDTKAKLRAAWIRRKANKC